MKIAVSGSHSVGKTTLVEWISNFYGLPAIGEQARRLLYTKYSFSDIEKDLELFKQFQSEIIADQMAIENEYESSFVVDRPFVDSLAYVEERLCKDRDNDISYLEKYRFKVFSLHKRNHYDLIIHLSPSKDIIMDDGNRNVNWIYVQMIDRLIDYYFHVIYGSNYSKYVLRVFSDNFEERTLSVQNRIGWMR